MRQNPLTSRRSPRVSTEPRLILLAVILLSCVLAPPASAVQDGPDGQKRLPQFSLSWDWTSAQPAGAWPGPLSVSRQSLFWTGASAPGESAGNEHRASAPWASLDRNVLAIFSGPNTILHLSAVAGTVLIVASGLDTQVHNFFVRNTFFEKYSHFGVSQGSTFPVLLGGGLLASGLVGGSSRLVSAGGAVLQASLLALCTTTALKALTGRPGPEPVIYGDNGASGTFRFGFLRGGVFHGWPSGHMMANTAAVTSLLAFSRSTWLNIAGGAYLGYMFLSVISHGRSSMHWFSDAVAGALMGYAIGTTVGRDFRRRWEGKAENTSPLSFSVVPPVFSVSFSFEL